MQSLCTMDFSWLRAFSSIDFVSRVLGVEVGVSGESLHRRSCLRASGRPYEFLWMRVALASAGEWESSCVGKL